MIQKGIFKRMDETNHEQIVYCNDSSSGLKAIIAIHNTVLGPARLSELGYEEVWFMRLSSLKIHFE